MLFWVDWAGNELYQEVVWDEMSFFSLTLFFSLCLQKVSSHFLSLLCPQGAATAERWCGVHPQAGRCQLVRRGTSREGRHLSHQLRGGASASTSLRQRKPTLLSRLLSFFFLRALTCSLSNLTLPSFASSTPRLSLPLRSLHPSSPPAFRCWSMEKPWPCITLLLTCPSSCLSRR